MDTEQRSVFVKNVLGRSKRVFFLIILKQQFLNDYLPK